MDLKKLRELAEKAGGDEWWWRDGDRCVWFGDGDSALTVMNPIPVHIAHDNLGTWPESIDAEDVAAFSAAANPAAVIAMMDETQTLRAVLQDIMTEKLIEDANRYRWLRSGARNRQGVAQSGGVRMIALNTLRSLMTFSFWCSPVELDTAIDAAMTKESADPLLMARAKAALDGGGA